MKLFKYFAISLIAISLLVPAQVWAGSLGSQKVVKERICTNTAKALPASTQDSLFTISGGPIEIISLTGEVTTLIQTQGCSLKVVADPTTPNTDTDLCTYLDINADAAGTIYSLVTNISTALAKYTNGVGPGMGQVFGVIVPVGAIDLKTDATNTGNITWRLRYRPLHEGVKVIAN